MSAATSCKNWLAFWSVSTLPRREFKEVYKKAAVFPVGMMDNAVGDRSILEWDVLKSPSGGMLMSTGAWLRAELNTASKDAVGWCLGIPYPWSVWGCLWMMDTVPGDDEGVCGCSEPQQMTYGHVARLATRHCGTVAKQDANGNTPSLSNTDNSTFNLIFIFCITNALFCPCWAVAVLSCHHFSVRSSPSAPPVVPPSCLSSRYFPDPLLQFLWRLFWQPRYAQGQFVKSADANHVWSENRLVFLHTHIQAILWAHSRTPHDNGDYRMEWEGFARLLSWKLF